jgi:acyl-coenzyme A synthetase/AMP-(fatty) acid ligase
LNSVAGVQDGVFVVPAQDGRGMQRLAVVAVAPGLDSKTLKQALRRLIDPAFLPRTVLFVDRLPRNETGKIPREQLLELLRTHAGEA